MLYVGHPNSPSLSLARHPPHKENRETQNHAEPRAPQNPPGHPGADYSGFRRGKDHDADIIAGVPRTEEPTANPRLTSASVLVLFLQLVCEISLDSFAYQGIITSTLCSPVSTWVQGHVDY